MDHLRFDTAIRTLAFAHRRGVLRAIAGFGVLAATIGGETTEPVSAKRRGRKRCRGGKKRCGRRCVPGTCCPGKACGSAEPNCRCGRTVEGRGFCQTGGVIKVEPCDSNADCGPGEACVPDDAGPDAFCIPPCGAAP